MAELSEDDLFLSAFGMMVVAWNKAEYWARQHINWQCGHDNVLILTSEMNSVTARDTIHSIANYMPNVDLAGHLTHFADYFDILREYRNYYAHGVYMILSVTGRTTQGIVSKIAGRPRLAIDTDFVTKTELEFVASHSLTLSNYASATQCAFIQPGGGIEQARQLWPSWPDKPPLPAKLQKSRAKLDRRAPLSE